MALLVNSSAQKTHVAFLSAMQTREQNKAMRSYPVNAPSLIAERPMAKPEIASVIGSRSFYKLA